MEELFLFYVAGWRLLNIYFSLPLRAPYKLSGFGMWWKKDFKGGLLYGKAIPFKRRKT